MRTRGVPPCEFHPDYAAWSNEDLVRGQCPVCFWLVHDGKTQARVLRARRLVAELESETPESEREAKS